MRQTIIYNRYSCPACNRHIVTHNTNIIYVESPFHKCRSCGAEVTVLTSQEYETLTPLERSFFWGGHVFQLVLVPLFLGLPLGLGLFVLVGMIPGGVSSAVYAVGLIPPLLIAGWVSWIHWSAITASKKRMIE